MQEVLKVALVQTHLIWENATAGRAHFENILFETEAADIYILPEMFATGFSMNAQTLAETIDGETVKWMQEMAVELEAAVCGSLIITENGRYYNRFIFVTPEAKIYTYNKRHTFTLAGEDTIFTEGQERVIIPFKGWNILPQVCYDLRFPVWARNTGDYDLMIYVANWPVMRIEAWNALLKARAIENMSYCIGVNRTGTDGNNIPYNGNSTAYDALGNVLVYPLEMDAVYYTTLSKTDLITQRTKFKFLDDADSFTVQ